MLHSDFYSISNDRRTQKAFASDALEGAQNEPPQKVSFWCMNHFELKDN